MRLLFLSTLVPALLSAILILPAVAAEAPADSGASSEAAPTEWHANYHSAGNRPGASSGFALGEGPTGGVWQRSQLLGDPLSMRSRLGRYGISLNLQETSEYLGNVSGGTRQGFVYDGLTTMDLQVDTKRAFGFRNGLFNVSALEVHGLNLSARNLSSLQTSSGIEADPGIRLWELWYQQAFYYRQIDVKVGAQSLDQEFMVSQYAGLFVNTMFGWPALTSYDMLSGGPAYPLASLGARLRVQPAGTPWSFLGGVFDDNPSGIAPGSTDDPQHLDNHGTNFRLKDKPLAIFEVQYSRPAVGELEYPGETPVLPGTYKLGFWYDFARFADQRYGTDGLSLSDPNSNGEAQLHAGNYSFYGVIDQLVWRESPESTQGVGIFFRGMIAPPDQNPLNASVNAGVTWHTPFKHREYDVMGLGFGWANVSNRASALDRDTQQFNANPSYPVRGSETILDLTYQYQLVPWWQLQPDFQYVFHVAGGIPSPSDPTQTQTLANEFVFGLRTNITL